MDTSVLIAIIVGAVIIAGLAFYAGTLLWRVQQQRLAQQQQAAQLQQQKAEKALYLRDSIILICKAMREEQCELSEGSLRLWVLLDHLVPERVWQELSRGLMEAQPSRMFAVLRQCGALKALFPEIDALFGVPAPAKWHPEIDTGIHTLMVLEQACRQQQCTPAYAGVETSTR